MLQCATLDPRSESATKEHTSVSESENSVEIFMKLFLNCLSKNYGVQRKWDLALLQSANYCFFFLLANSTDCIRSPVSGTMRRDHFIMNAVFSSVPNF